MISRKGFTRTDQTPIIPVNIWFKVFELNTS
jgi:hypothetical protein